MLNENICNDRGGLRLNSLSKHVQCRDVRTREVGIQEIHHKVRPYQVGHLWREGEKRPFCIRPTQSYLCASSGGADTEGLCGQRRLGDLPLLRGPRAGHPDRPAAPASLLASVLPPGAERGRVNRPRAPRVRERGPRQQPRPQQVPAPGRFSALDNDDWKRLRWSTPYR